GIAVQVIDDPALALSDHLIAKLLGCQLVAPLTKSSFRELLNVTLVDQRHRLAAVLQRVLDSHADQALGSTDGHRLDADARILADTFTRTGQHGVVEEIDQLFGLRGTLP